MMIERILYTFLPYVLAASGALASELAGSLAVFVDGFIHLGGFVFWLVANATRSLLLGGLAAMATGAFLAWGLGQWTRASGSNPFIVALAVNAGAVATSDSLSWLIFGKRGELLPAPGSPLFAPSEESGLLAEIASLAASPLVWLSFAGILSLGIFIAHSRKGLHLRAAGSSPRALEEWGIAVAPLRDLSWMIAGAGAALAGALLVWRLAAFSPSLAAGRGWIALAIVFMGQRRLSGVLFAALFFSLAELFAVESRLFGSIPPALLQAVPALLALLLYVVQSHSRINGSPLRLFSGVLKHREESAPPSTKASRQDRRH